MFYFYIYSVNLLQEIARVNPMITDDQIRLNIAMNKSGITWTKSTSQFADKIGFTSHYKVAIISEDLICRSKCSKVDGGLDSFLLVHQLSPKRPQTKVDILRYLHLYFIKENEYLRINTTQRMDIWLANVCTF